MVDTSKVVDKLQQRSLAESPQVRRHRGVVQSVASDGTVGITLDGGTTVLTGVRRLANVSVSVGDTVEVLGDDTDLLILGPVSSSTQTGEAFFSTRVRVQVGSAFPAISAEATAQQVVIKHPTYPNAQWQFEYLSSGTPGFWLKFYDGVYNGILLFTKSQTFVHVPFTPVTGNGDLVKYDLAYGMSIVGSDIRGVSHIPYKNGRMYLSTRSDQGTAGEFYIRKESGSGYTTQFTIDGNGRIAVPQEFATNGAFRVETITDGTRIGAHSMLAHIDFLRSGTTDTVFINANDWIQSPTIYARATTGGNSVMVGSDGRLYRYTSSLKSKKNWKHRSDLADVDLPDPIEWEGRDDLNTEKGRMFIGFGAEHIAEALPTLARFNDDGEPDDIDDRAILAVLVAKVKRLERLANA